MHDDRGGGVAQGGGHLQRARHPPPRFAAAIERVQTPQMCGANPFAPDSLGNFLR